MAKVHEIGVGADTRAFEDQIKRGVIKPTEDAEKALQKLGDTDAGSDAARDVDKLEDALKDAQQASKKLGDAGDRAGDDVRKGMKRAEEGVEDFKQEAQQSVKETAASFSDVTDAVDLVQEVAANAFVGFGPAGVVAGAAAAVGIGAAVSGFEAVNEAEQESRERAAEWAQAFIEAGSKVLTAATTSAIAMDIATDAEKFKTAQDNAKNWGVDVSTAIAAMSGEAWALNAANDSITESSKKVADEMAEVGLQYDWVGESMTDLNTRTAAGQRSLDELRKEMDLGGQQADAYSRYLVQVAEHTDGATRAVDEFGDTVVTLPDGKQIYIDAETGQATQNVDQIEQKIYGIPDGNATVNVDTYEAQRAVNRFVTQNEGRTIKINGRFVAPGGGQIP